MAINDDLQDVILRNQHRIVQFERTINLAIQGNLAELSLELRRFIEDENLAAVRTTRQEQRLQALKKEVDRAIGTTYVENGRELQLGLNELGNQTQRLTVAGMNSVFTVNIIEPTLTTREMRVLTRDPVVLGLKTSEWWGRQAGSTRSAFTREMRLGIASGETNDQLVKRIIGSPTGAKENVIIDGKPRKVPQRTGGIMDLSKREATSLVRSSTQTVSNRVLQETYGGNTDVIKGVAVLVTLDGRTTTICMSLSGGVWNIITGDPTPDSPKQIPYPGPPPYHHQCRTVISPVTKSWKELGSPAKKEILDKAKRPDSVRASMDGEVPGLQQYTGFLRGQNVKFQNQVLGTARAKLFREGKLQLHQLTDATLTPINLDQLAKIVD